MSYILEALRRAEAERERARGQVPGLHAQPLANHAEAAPAAAERRWLLWGGSGLLTLVLVGVIVLAGIGSGSRWTGGPREAAAPTAQAVPVRSTTTAPMAPSPAPTVQQSVGSMPVPQPVASASPYLPPAPAPGALTAAPPAPALAIPAAASAIKRPTPLPSQAPASLEEARIPRLSELPESTRRELPKLAIAGLVYSDDPASRFVIINGEVLREGAPLGADLVLAQIRPHELVLRFKGQLFLQPV